MGGTSSHKVGYMFSAKRHLEKLCPRTVLQHVGMRGLCALCNSAASQCVPKGWSFRESMDNKNIKNRTTPRRIMPERPFHHSQNRGRPSLRDDKSSPVFFSSQRKRMPRESMELPQLGKDIHSEQVSCGDLLACRPHLHLFSGRKLRAKLGL